MQVSASVWFTSIHRIFLTYLFLASHYYLKQSHAWQINDVKFLRKIESLWKNNVMKIICTLYPSRVKISALRSHFTDHVVCPLLCVQPYDRALRIACSYTPLFPNTHVYYLRWNNYSKITQIYLPCVAGKQIFFRYRFFARFVRPIRLLTFTTVSSLYEITNHIKYTLVAQTCAPLFLRESLFYVLNYNTIYAVVFKRGF